MKVRWNNPKLLAQRGAIAEGNRQRALDARNRPSPSTTAGCAAPQQASTPSLREAASWHKGFLEPTWQREAARQKAAAQEEQARLRQEQLRKEQDEKAIRDHEARIRDAQNRRVKEAFEAKEQDKKSAAEFEQEFEIQNILNNLLQPFRPEACKQIIALLPAGFHNRLGYEFAIGLYKADEKKRQEQQQERINAQHITNMEKSRKIAEGEV